MFKPTLNKKTLIIHGRRGLFCITKCTNCKYTWECENCAKNLEKGVNLVAYRSKFELLELLCHQCQTYYKYPLECPKCNTKQVVSLSGGVEDLAERLKEEYDFNVIRIDKFKSHQQINESLIYKQNNIWLTTRVFDPAINYSFFDEIVIIQAQNLLASSDYLVQEEIMNSIGSLLLFATQNEHVKITLDTTHSESGFFQNLTNLNKHSDNVQSVWQWYSEFLEKESKMRQIFKYPPFVNLLLLTSHEKSFEKAKNKLLAVKSYLDVENNASQLNLEILQPYPARFLKRKGLFSYNLLIKYPRSYTKFSILKNEVVKQASLHKLQIRHNPRHIF